MFLSVGHKHKHTEEKSAIFQDGRHLATINNQIYIIFYQMESLSWFGGHTIIWVLCSNKHVIVGL